MSMSKLVPTTIYIDPQLKKQVDAFAVTTRRKKADIMRDALEKGLEVLHKQKGKKYSSTKSLLQLADKADEIDAVGPTDLSERHDSYTWDE
jgi:hypothetical protein